ncbi:hypothetical protein Vi05172_g1597 [Venturia inaequalis]|nr:hypothetical protein Vi05172_g1597 [Venturia inaequalis]
MTLREGNSGAGEALGQTAGRSSDSTTRGAAATHRRADAQTHAHRPTARPVAPLGRGACVTEFGAGHDGICLMPGTHPSAVSFR